MWISRGIWRRALRSNEDVLSLTRLPALTEEIKSQFLAELISKSPDLLASVWIIDRVPSIFEGKLEYFASWRATLAKGLGVDPSSIVITGSAAFGVSLNPYKNYKLFDADSDVDVAVISDFHFTQAWHCLRNLGSRRHKLSVPMKESFDDHVKRLIYWGTIATDRLLPILPFGSDWIKALEAQARVAPTNGRTINARIYRDHASLRAYHVNNISSLRTAEFEKEI